VGTDHIGTTAQIEEKKMTEETAITETVEITVEIGDIQTDNKARAQGETTTKETVVETETVEETDLTTITTTGIIDKEALALTITIQDRQGTQEIGRQAEEDTRIELKAETDYRIGIDTEVTTDKTNDVTLGTNHRVDRTAEVDQVADHIIGNQKNATQELIAPQIIKKTPQRHVQSVTYIHIENTNVKDITFGIGTNVGYVNLQTI